MLIEITDNNITIRCFTQDFEELARKKPVTHTVKINKKKYNVVLKKGDLECQN